MMKLTICVILTAVVLITIYGNTETFAEPEAEVNQPTIDLQYIVDLEHIKYVKYRICASTETLYTQIVIIKSPQESKTISTEIILVANTCKDYSAIIKAKYVNQISVEMI